MSRSTDTLTKSTVTDYKKMMSNGSIDSMDKSVLSSETSYDIYEAHQQQYGNGKSGYADPKFPDTLRKPPAEPKVYGLPDYNPQGFELSFRNEGFKDNSTYSGTRNNSVGTYINEDTPIIHQTDPEDSNSDYYGNSSTLPMRVKTDNLSFLSELKNKLPDYEKLPKQKPAVQSSFLPTPPESPYPRSAHTNTSQYEKQVNSPSPKKPTIHEYQKPEVRRPNAFVSPPPEVRRPDSYYTAMRTAPESRPQPPPPSVVNRPKTVYEASDDRRSYARSKSEAILETNFDDEPMQPSPLTSDSRSYSQPLETAM